MFSGFAVEVQVYLFALVCGITAPLVVYLLLRSPLQHFLAAIFANPQIERFWMRVVLLALLFASLSASIGFDPDDAVGEDFIVIVWALADQVQYILQGVLMVMFALFLPLLLSYTILYVGRERRSDN